jgi:hypothetical protein
MEVKITANVLWSQKLYTSARKWWILTAEWFQNVIHCCVAGTDCSGYKWSLFVISKTIVRYCFLLKQTNAQLMSQQHTSQPYPCTNPHCYMFRYLHAIIRELHRSENSPQGLSWPVKSVKPTYLHTYPDLGRYGNPSLQGKILTAKPGIETGYS